MQVHRDSRYRISVDEGLPMAPIEWFGNRTPIKWKLSFFQPRKTRQ